MKLNDQWNLERDNYQWIVTETYTGLSRNKDGSRGKEKKHTRKTYHGRLSDALKYVVDKSAGGCTSAGELLQHLDASSKQLCECAQNMRVCDFVVPAE